MKHLQSTQNKSQDLLLRGMPLPLRLLTERMVQVCSLLCLTHSAHLLVMGQEYEVVRLGDTLGSSLFRMSYAGEAILTSDWTTLEGVYNSTDSTRALIVIAKKPRFVPGWLYWYRGHLFSLVRSSHGPKKFVL